MRSSFGGTFHDGSYVEMSSGTSGLSRGVLSFVSGGVKRNHQSFSAFRRLVKRMGRAVKVSHPIPLSGSTALQGIVRRRVR